MRFTHLHLHSPYSFLDGASDLETLARRAAELGMPALALTDHDNLSAAVKFGAACAGYGIRPILGVELTLEPVGNEAESHLTLLAKDRGGYANLCRLVSRGFDHGGRLSPHARWEDLWNHGEGLICLSGCRRGRISTLTRDHRYDEAQVAAEALRGQFGVTDFYIELQDDFTPDSHRVCRELAQLADSIGVGVVATNNVHYARREDYITHEALRCIATKTPLDSTHAGRPLNSERYLKSRQEMTELFAWRPDALSNTPHIAERCANPLPRGEEITPGYTVPPAHDGSAAYLKHLTYKGARARYGEIGPHIVIRIEHELSVICGMGYADYMLMCWEAVRWARRQGIRATGRGSAADSCVAYCLYLTDVDVIRRDLPFARFLTEGKTPDVDVDFPSERRDEVFNYLTARYGARQVAACCTFSTFRSKSAVRDVGKALGLPQEVLEWFSQHLSHFVHADQLHEAFDRFAELKPHAALRNRFEVLFGLCARIANFPRHMGSHSSGIVISRVPLDTIAPLSPSARGVVPIWTLDKDDCEEVGAIKFDILSLRTLAAVSDAETDIRHTNGRFKYDRIPDDDEETYRMLRAGAAVGAFQLESSAQLALACTLQPDHFEDLVASVALIRPGPVRGDAVQRYVSCRNGYASASFLHPCLVPILAKTFGTILFQEQAIQVIAAMTGCTEADADKVRKSLAKHARANTMEVVRNGFVRSACEMHPDLDETRANLLFDMLEGWSGYGFTEGHAAAFGLTAYRTAYLSVHHTAEYFAGFMNHQPLGFYSSNTLAAEARRRGVQIRPVDINISADKCSGEWGAVSPLLAKEGVGGGGPHVPSAPAIRLGLRVISGMREEDIAAILEARQSGGPFRSLLDFCARVILHRDTIESLILCGAFDSLHEHRRGLLWRLEETLALALSYRANSDPDQTAIPLGSASTLATPIAWDIADLSPWDKFLWAWRITGICADCHPFAYLRERLARRGIVPVDEVKLFRPGSRVTVAGLNIRPHRPPTRSGKPVLFTTVEDETGLIQVTCVNEAIDTCTATFLTSPAVVVRGIVERKGTGASIKVEMAKPLRLQDHLDENEPGKGHLAAAPPSVATYTGTRLVYMGA